MSKKKRKHRAHKRKNPTIRSVEQDVHHICYQRARWSGGAVGELRDFYYCRMSIPKYTLHRMIHSKVHHVPVPKSVNAKEALRQLKMLEAHGAIKPTDHLEKRLELLAALFDCADQPTADAFRAQLEVVRRFYKKPSS